MKKAQAIFPKKKPAAVNYYYLTCLICKTFPVPTCKKPRGQSRLLASTPAVFLHPWKLLGQQPHSCCTLMHAGPLTLVITANQPWYLFLQAVRSFKYCFLWVFKENKLHQADLKAVTNHLELEDSSLSLLSKHCSFEAKFTWLKVIKHEASYEGAKLQS